MITPTSPEWILLSEIYHHVLKRSPSPERAKIDIQSRQLSLRAEVREHRAMPGLRLKYGEQPPAEMPTITFDQPILADGYDTWDWERNYATRCHAITKSLFEYVNIVGRRDDVLAAWPAEDRATPSAPEAVVAEVTATASLAKTPRRKWQQDRLNQYLAKHYPDGVPDTEPTGAVRKKIGDDMSDNVPSWDTVNRKLGRQLPRT